MGLEFYRWKSTSTDNILYTEKYISNMYPVSWTELELFVHREVWLGSDHMEFSVKSMYGTKAHLVTR